MRKGFIALLTAISIVAFGTQAGAVPKKTQVQVVYGGETLAFLLEPVVIENKVYVEFRTLFEKLGYAIEYSAQTRTITAAKPGHKILISLDGDVAFSDDKAVSSAGEVKIVKNRAMLGDRFIAGLTGKEVEWDSAKRVVTVKDNGPTEEQEAAVLAVFDKILSFEASADQKGIAGLFAADTPLDLKAYLPDFDKVKTKTAFLELLIQSCSDTEAVVKSKDETVRLGGGYFLDNRTETKYTLHRDASGQWKLYNIEMLGGEIINKDKLPGLFELAAAVPDADKTAILAVVDAQFKASNAENLTDYLATMTFKNDDEKTQLAQNVKAVFDQIDAAATVEKAVIVDYDAAGKATLLLSTVTELKSAGGTAKIRTILQNGAEKKDGKWLLSPYAFPLDNAPAQ